MLTFTSPGKAIRFLQGYCVRRVAVKLPGSARQYPLRDARRYERWAICTPATARRIGARVIAKNF